MKQQARTSADIALTAWAKTLGHTKRSIGRIYTSWIEALLLFRKDGSSDGLRVFFSSTTNVIGKTKPVDAVSRIQYLARAAWTTRNHNAIRSGNTWHIGNKSTPADGVIDSTRTPGIAALESAMAVVYLHAKSGSQSWISDLENIAEWYDEINSAIKRADIQRSIGLALGLKSAHVILGGLNRPPTLTEKRNRDICQFINAEKEARPDRDCIGPAIQKFKLKRAMIYKIWGNRHVHLV